MPKRIKVVFIAGVPIALLVILLCFISTAQWSGGFDLPITVLDGGKPVAPEEIASVRYTCYLPRETDREIDDGIMTSENQNLLDNAEFDNGNYTARIPCGGKRSILGFLDSYKQFEFVFIRVELTDGRAVALTCPVSHKDKNPRIFLDMKPLQ